MTDKNNLIYYTSEMIENTIYYQFPKWLIGVEGMSNNCRVLYMMLLDRCKLSLKNKWVDKENRVYSYFSKESASKMMGVSVSTCYKSFKELIERGFIEQIRQGQGRNNKIYLKQVNYEEFTKTYKNHMSENDDTEYRPKKRKKHMSKPQENRGLDLQNLDTSNNELSNKEMNNSSSSSEDNNINNLLKETSSIDGMLVNDKEYQEINNLISMSPHLNTTKQDIIEFLHKLYDEENNRFITWDGKRINNLQNFVECSFSRKHNRDQEEIRIIKQKAEDGDYWAQKIVDERPILFANLDN